MNKAWPFLSRAGQSEKYIDVCIVLFLAFFVGITAARIDYSIPPMEDAAMLMRYAGHIAEGAGCVWNVGDRPVDGATDFLFMAVTALLTKAGLSLESSVRLIGLASHGLTVIIVYVALRTLYQAYRIPALISALYLAAGPGLLYITACFGTPFFALFACITWWIALKLLLQDENRHLLSLLFAVSGLITGLIRPEGVILASLMLLCIVCYRGVRRSLVPVLYFGGIFLVLGGLYFVWRWQYFGYPLPNPFYKKGGGALHSAGLVSSVSYAIALTLPLLLTFLSGVRSRQTLRLLLCFSIPLGGFVAAFVLISEEMNIAGRFQYAILPMTLICWYPLVKGICNDFRLPKWSELDRYQHASLMLFAGAISLGSLGYIVVVQTSTPFRLCEDGRYKVASMLADYRGKGYTIATTEAGLLPLYSQWHAVDAWGLNDQWIAHHGIITSEYLDRYKPEVIMSHSLLSSPGLAKIKLNGWMDTVQALHDYAEKNNYVLAAVFGRCPDDTHYYYVRGDCADGKEIVQRIRSMEYLWFADGQAALNFALLTRRNPD